ncbi:30S ribosomal protein S13 [Candidatus Woesearchaeota archaeon]|nr:30S ribosomal protein S13 [Candidatus Woesearchaeota archaeon]
MEEKKDFKHLVRIANTDLDGNKLLAYALKNIKGIGFQFANIVCSLAGIDKTKKTGELSDSEIKKLDEVIADPAKAGIPDWMLNRRKDYENNSNKHLLSADLTFTQDNDVKRMKKIKCYRGMRHAYGLPVRGQRTKSNFRKSKGKVMGVKRKAGTKTGK